MALFSRFFRQTSSPPPAVEPTPPPAVEERPAPVSVQPAEEVVAAALNSRDPAQIAKLVTDGASSRVRQLAAETIEDPEQLRQLIPQVRAKDKNVYKILKQKTDALLAQERQAAQIQNDIEAACAALERHGPRPYDALFLPTLEHLEEQWNSLSQDATGDHWRRAEKAIERCRATVSQQLQKIAGQAAHEAAVAGADPQRQAILDELRQMLIAVYAAEPGATLPEAATQQTARCAERWAQAERYKPASSADVTSYDRLRTAISQVGDSIAQHGALGQQALIFREAAPDADLIVQVSALRKTLAPASLLGDAAPAAVTEAADALKAWEQARNDKMAAQALALRQLGGLIKRAGDAVREGNTRQAAGMRRALEEKLQNSPAMPGHLIKQVEQLDEKLNELKDWKSYAVTPKRAELIQDMEALIGSSDDPTVLANKIKDLQEQWKSISRGAVSDAEAAEADWQRFHQAAQTAYQPCKAYFEAQAKQRQDNLEKRQALLERLTAFDTGHNWEAPDWRLVATALRESWQEWRRYSPVERAAGKALQDSFNALTAKLQERLETEHGRNLTEKKSLVARAQKLLTSEDGRAAIDEVKRLQSLWKESGPVPREEDQKLWAQFREHCDAVFQKRQQQGAEYAAGLEENKSKAIALCEQAEQLAALSGVELLDGAKTIPELQTAFDAAGELPRANARELQSRFERAVNRIQANVAAQKARDKEQSWSRLLEAGSLIQAYRLSVAQGADIAEQGARKQAAQSFIEGVTQWPKGGLQAVQTELAKEAPVSVDRATNESALRVLCIRAEILTDSPTPAEDQALRRNYQMQRLMKSMGQGVAAADAEQLDVMVFEWMGVGAIEAAVYPQLLERFVRCRQLARRA